MSKWIPLKERPLIAADWETYLSIAGRYVPRSVCGSFYDDDDAKADAQRAAELAALIGSPGVAIPSTPSGGHLFLRDQAAQMFGAVLTDPKFREQGGLVVGANFAFDSAVMGSDFPELLPEIFNLYDRQGVFDVLIGQALDHVAEGRLFKDSPEQKGTGMKSPKGEIKKRYSLELVTFQRLGIYDAKKNDEFRLKYGWLLENVPFEQWPANAKQYPIDDSRHAYNDAKDLIARGQNMHPLVRVIPSQPPATWQGVTVDWFKGEQGVYLTHPGLNAYAAFCLHLLTAWGLRVDAAPLRELIKTVEANHQKEIDQYVGIGLLKAGCEKHDQDPLFPDRFNPNCLSCQEERGKENGVAVKRAIIRAYNPGRADLICKVCSGTGKIKSPKSGNPIQCKACSATGLDPGQSPTTEGGGISASRDACLQSGDHTLADLKESGNRKIRQTYIPFLSDGVVSPIHVSANALLKTARTSFGKGDDSEEEKPGLLQTFPRKGGVRETMFAEPGWWLCSNDWTALEFYNLGQAQKWVCGYSPILDALREGKDPHVMLGSKMTGTGYADFMANRKSKYKKIKTFYNDVRQGAKLGNYGFGGRMGAATFVFNQRIQRVGDHGSMCRLMHREPARGCGSEKITVWKKRPTKGPMCAACVEVSEELRKGWLELWQLQEYFDWVDSHPGIQDNAGVMVTPGTGYVRGGLNVSEGCNHPFQHQGGYGSKLALCMVSRECYVDRGTPLFGARPNVFAHDEIMTAMVWQTAHLAAARQTELMQAAMSIIVPDLVVPIEPALMRRWYKSAEPVFYAPGQCDCWEGWIFKVDTEGKPYRLQCPHCKEHGRLWAWEPMPEDSVALAMVR